MSDKPISVGDLVMVVRPSLCIGGMNGIGHVFRVTEIYLSRDAPHELCFYCKKLHSGNTLFAGENEYASWAVERLMRIDPPALKDDVPTKEELHA